MIRRLPGGDAAGVAAAAAITSLAAAGEALVLNALDAGAGDVRVSLSVAAAAVRVEDDGSGIAASDMELVGSRGATSRAGGGGGYYYGRRGVALWCLAQLGQVDIASRPAGAAATRGKLLRDGAVVRCGVVSGGIVTPPLTRGATAVRVSDLFHGQPVRRKALSHRGEVDALLDALVRLSLVHPRVAFHLRDDDGARDVLRLPGLPPAHASAYGRFAQLHGTERAEATVALSHHHATPESLLLPPGANSAGIDAVTVSASPSVASLSAPSPQVTLGVTVTGFVGLGHRNRDLQYVFINGAYCKRTPQLTAAVEAAVARAGRSGQAALLGLTVTPGGSGDDSGDRDPASTAGGSRKRSRSAAAAAAAAAGTREAADGHPVFVVDVAVDPPSCVDVVHEADRTLAAFANWPAVEEAVKATVAAAFGLNDAGEAAPPVSAGAEEPAVAIAASPAAHVDDGVQQALRVSPDPVFSSSGGIADDDYDGNGDGIGLPLVSMPGLQLLQPDSVGGGFAGPHSLHGGGGCTDCHQHDQWTSTLPSTVAAPAVVALSGGGVRLPPPPVLPAAHPPPQPPAARGGIDDALFPPTPPLPLKRAARTGASAASASAPSAASAATWQNHGDRTGSQQQLPPQLVPRPPPSRGSYTGRDMQPSDAATAGAAAGVTLRPFPSAAWRAPAGSASAGLAAGDAATGGWFGGVSPKVQQLAAEPALLPAVAGAYAAFTSKARPYAETYLHKAGAAATSAATAWTRPGPARGRQNQAYVAHGRALVVAATAATAAGGSGFGAPAAAPPDGVPPAAVAPAAAAAEAAASPAAAALPSHVTSLGGLRVDRAMLPRLRVCGQLDRKFILATVDVGSGGGGARQLVIIDQHAVDERIRVEAIEAVTFPSADGAPADVSGDGAAGGALPPLHSTHTLSPDGLTLVPREERGDDDVVDDDGAAARDDANAVPAPCCFLSQVAVVPPRVLQASARELQAVRWHQPLLAAWGFSVDVVDAPPPVAPQLQHGGEVDGAVAAAAAPPVLVVRALPVLFDIVLSCEDLRDYVGFLADTPHAGAEGLRVVTSGTAAGERAATLRRLYHAGCRPPAVTRALNSKACRGAVMFGDALTTPQCDALLARLQGCRLPFQCAHGRPSMVPLATMVER